MRRSMTSIFLILLLAAVPASAGKIGFVNAELAMSQVEEAQQEFNELRRWQDVQQTNLDQLRDRVVALREQLAEAQEVGPEEAISSVERNEIEARRAFEDARREYERELEERKDEFLSVVATKIGAVGIEYAKANDYDAVFLLTGQPMVYVSETADITEEVIKAYNERYPAE